MPKGCTKCPGNVPLTPILTNKARLRCSNGHHFEDLLCNHGLHLIKQQTKKEGQNQGRYFWSCPGKNGQYCKDKINKDKHQIWWWDDDFKKHSAKLDKKSFTNGSVKSSISATPSSNRSTSSAKSVSSIASSSSIRSLSINDGASNIGKQRAYKGPSPTLSKVSSSNSSKSSKQSSNQSFKSSSLSSKPPAQKPNHKPPTPQSSGYQSGPRGVHDPRRAQPRGGRGRGRGILNPGAAPAQNNTVQITSRGRGNSNRGTISNRGQGDRGGRPNTAGRSRRPNGEINLNEQLDNNNRQIEALEEITRLRKKNHGILKKQDKQARNIS